MNLARCDSASAIAGDEDRPAVSLQASKVLADLFAQIDKDRPLTILEVGLIVPETVQFFSRYRCRIHVLDLFTELTTGTLDETVAGSTLQRRFQDLFRFEVGTVVDICLLWDFPHYLNEYQLRAFSRALWPWLNRESRAHGFGVHSAATILSSREYGIVDEQTISVRPRVLPGPPRSPHPQSFMNEWLTCFSTSRGVLLPDGRVETLMHARV